MIISSKAGSASPVRECAALKGMFEARKQVFVDLLKWDIPVVNDRFEIDQFDDEHAQYLIVSNMKGAHAASCRLLKTTRPHILDTLFPELCDAAIPRGHSTLEITRFCLDRNQSSAERLESRNCLVSALVAHALANGIERYTGVAEMGWLSQILSFGWDCSPLGLPRRFDGRLLGALSISITPRTPSLLAANLIFREEPFDQFGFAKAA
jgi:N-acyl-L-homoserine lactone synthetase